VSLLHQLLPINFINIYRMASQRQLEQRKR